MACDECRELNTHAFRSAEDLVYAVRLASEEMERGVLSREDLPKRANNEQRAIDSFFESGALPPVLNYRFKCQICGDEFTLLADTKTGEGNWTREEADGPR